MITAIIQARTGSTRLPNKIFFELAGKPLIWHVCERLKWTKTIDKIVLATTVNKADDPLEQWALNNHINVFRGSEEDVLGRFYYAAKQFKSNFIVRVTADDPFKDPVIIDEVVEMVLDENLDFGFNNNPPTFPEGLDTEVFTFQSLEKAFEMSKDPFEREHVTQYFYRHPEKFSIKNYPYKKNVSRLRWTIDNEEDYTMAKIIYNNLYKKNKIFYFQEILSFLKANPDVEKINSNVLRSTMYQK